MKILLIEDGETLRACVKCFLTKHAYYCMEAANGKEALALATHENGKFDLVLTDFHMPEMDGREFITAFRARWPLVPIILMSADPTIDSALLGADHFLIKPFDIHKFLALIEDLSKTKTG